MKQQIIDILSDSNDYKYKGESWWRPIKDEHDAMEYLLENGRTVKEQNKSDRRWWYEFTHIKEFETEDDVYYIGYTDAHSTRDMGAVESGFMYDTDSVRLYEEKQVTVTEYVPIDESS